MYKELKGVCRQCLGCNRLELEDFEGLEQCEYASVKQIGFEQMEVTNEK